MKEITRNLSDLLRKIQIKNIEQLFINLFYFLTLLSGLVVGLLNLFNINILITYFSIFTFILLILIILSSLYKKNVQKYELNIIILFSIVFFTMLVKIIIYPDNMNIASLQIVISFYLLPFLVFFSVRNNYRDDSILNFLRLIGFIIIIFAYIQLIFSISLPSYLRFIPHPSIPDYIGVIRFSEFIFYPPNGLIGTQMIFGTFLVFTFILYLSDFFNSKSYFKAIKIVLNFILIFFLFSRVAFIGAICIFFIFLYFYTSRKSFIIYIVIFFICFTFIVFFLYEHNLFITYMIDRIIGIHQNAQVSKQEHIEDYISSYRIIISNPVLGLPTLSLGNEVITDGTWFRYLIDMGSICFLFYIIIWIYFLYIIYMSYNKFPEDNLSIIAFCMYLYITFANFFNSSFLAKINALFFMTIIGILYYRLNNLKGRTKE